MKLFVVFLVTVLPSLCLAIKCATCGTAPTDDCKDKADGTADCTDATHMCYYKHTKMPMKIERMCMAVPEGKTATATCVATPESTNEMKMCYCNTDNCNNVDLNFDDAGGPTTPAPPSDPPMDGGSGKTESMSVVSSVVTSLAFLMMPSLLR